MTIWAIKHKETGFYLDDEGNWHPILTLALIYTDYEAAKVYLELFNAANIAEIVEADL
jgi:hypothetical protein